ncbi:BAG family molecular chaperone regulator 1-like [Curcuma longa]|uniref:BAG family molecular chaperone regulator 1-like n=1 Tax=Curcuma longa TaxID=136217 RepID=UPI003D9F8C83
MPARSSVGVAGAAAAAAAEEKDAELEVTPGGMVVQKRDPDAAPPAAAVPTIRLKVKHGSVYHEIYISSQATFGDLKKMVAERVGMHPLDQRIIYKDKERDSAAFLDTAGVKDRSKLVVEEDATAKAKRLLEMRKNHKMEKATKAIASIARDVDKLASKVLALETIVNKGGRVVEEDVIRLIELLMNELIKLDGVVADGDAKQQRRNQVNRVQTYVETLDRIKIKNSAPRGNAQPKQHQNREPKSQRRVQFQQQQQQQPVIVTTDWETFDSLLIPSTSTAAIAVAPPTTTARLDWELF